MGLLAHVTHRPAFWAHGPNGPMDPSGAALKGPHADPNRGALSIEGGFGEKCTKSERALGLVTPLVVYMRQAQTAAWP